MKGYVKQALTELKHIAQTRHQEAPSKIKRPNYGATTQYVDNDDTRPLTPAEIKKIERALGKFLYYARGIDILMQHALNDIAAENKNCIKATDRAIKHFLDYAHSNPDAKIIFQASNTILNANFDAAYFVAQNARSPAGGCLYCRSKNGKLFNGAFYCLAKIIKSVMASAMEAKITALFINAQKLVKYCQTLQDMGYPQPPTPICTDSSSACGIINRTMKQKRSKSIDMRWNWLKDKTVNQKQFSISWVSGKTNLADYTTKHYAASHHKQVRPLYIYIYIYIYISKVRVQAHCKSVLTY